MFFKLIAWSALSLGLLTAQAPRIGIIEIYGLRKVPLDRIRGALQLNAGEPLPGSKADLEERLEQVPGIVLARVEAVCCEEGKAVLFVGVEETGAAARFSFRNPPTGQSALPDEGLTLYGQFLAALEDAERRGLAAEDLSQGHSLLADPGARGVQAQFTAFAAGNLAVLKDVLRNSADERQRAIAAVLIGYAPDKRAVIDDLEYAIQDPDEAVRANAARALNAIAVLARREPARGIAVHATWIIEMLNSIVLGDRLRASSVLVSLTETGPRDVLLQLRERALPALAEMAQWNKLEYALPAYILLGRTGGLSEEEIHATWKRGERAATIQRILAPKRKTKGTARVRPDRR